MTELERLADNVRKAHKALGGFVSKDVLQSRLDEARHALIAAVIANNESEPQDFGSVSAPDVIEAEGFIDATEDEIFEDTPAPNGHYGVY